MFPCNVYSNFTQPFLLTTISNSSNYNFELNHDFELACLSMLMVVINPVGIPPCISQQARLITLLANNDSMPRKR